MCLREKRSTVGGGGRSPHARRTHTHTDGGGRIDPRGYEVTVLDPTERTLSPARGHYADGRGKRLKDQDVENDNESQPWYPANNKEGFLLGTK